MNMNIFPVRRADSEKRHWVVRWLRYNGYIICIAATISGAVLAYNYGAMLFAFMGSSADEILSWVFAIVTLLLGGLVGFVAGLGISLPFWGLALMIDDLHAIRIHSGGYAATDGQK